MSTPFKYLQGYPPHLQQQVMQMVAEDRLGCSVGERAFREGERCR